MTQTGITIEQYEAARLAKMQQLSTTGPANWNKRDIMWPKCNTKRVVASGRKFPSAAACARWLGVKPPVVYQAIKNHRPICGVTVKFV